MLLGQGRKIDDFHTMARKSVDEWRFQLQHAGSSIFTGFGEIKPNDLFGDITDGGNRAPNHALEDHTKSVSRGQKE